MTAFGTPFSGFSVRDAEEAREFYAGVLGLDATVADMGILRIDLGDGHAVIGYPKGDAHEPASFTVLNLPVDDVGAAVAELAGRGIQFVHYDGMDQDEHGVMRGHGPDIAWFTDPSGNIVSVIAAGA